MVEKEIPRRNFLKYTVGLGATAAIGAAAYYYLGIRPGPVVPPQTSVTTSPYTSVTSATSLTASSLTTPTQPPATTEKLASLNGRLFFDFNGNGIQDGEEPAVSKATVQLKDNTGKIIAEAVTDSSGDYKLEDVLTGSHMLYVKADKKFGYMCSSIGEVRSVKENYGIFLSESRKNEKMNIGLMERFLTLPFPKKVPIYVDPKMGDYFDHDPGPDALWWNGKRLPAPRPHMPEYAHPETDFFMPKGTEVKAAVSGKVSSAKTESNGLKWISLTHLEGYGTTYLHVGEIKVPVGAYVNRGDTIALSSNTGTGSSDDFHTAFQLWRYMPDGNHYCIDPYSPVAGVAKGAWIAVSWKWYPSDEGWISQGYWTKFNDPQYSL